MDQCSICGEETSLYSGDVPICLKCEKERERKAKDKVARLLDEENSKTGSTH